MYILLCLITITCIFLVDADETKRRIWTQESKDIVIKKFMKNMENNVKISGAEIDIVINEHACLRGRSAAQVRSFLQAQRKKLKRTPKTESEHVASKNTKMKRNRVPPSIYVCFTDFINEGEVPDLSQCIQAYEKSPTLHKYKPQEIQNLVLQAINYDERDQSSDIDS